MKLLVLVLFFFSSASFAKGASSSGGTGPTLRLIGGASSIKPAEVNTSFEAQNLQKVSASLLLGGEIGYAFERLEFGIRYLNNQVSRREEPDNLVTNYSASISQDLVLVMARAPLLKTDYLHISLFGGYGGAASRLKVKSATQTGELNRSLFATAISTGGASLAIGHKNFFVVVEGGYLADKVTGFSRSGSISSDIQTVDMSGQYAAISLLFYGGDFGKFFSRK